LQSGSYIEIILLSNSIAAGTWDYHNQAPSNASWSTNTLTWVGTYSGGTWNGNVISGSYGGTGVNNGTNTITIAGNVTHSGVFTQTFTATANSSVTIPTSGTLISSVTALPGAVTGTPSSTTYLRGDGTWAAVSGGGPIDFNTTSISTAVSISSGQNGVSVGPITITGSVTVPAGQRWVIL